MSELKATTAQEIVRNEKDCDYMDELFGGVKMPPTQVYIKPEADKVIAEKDKELRHQKYKRCLDKAKTLDRDATLSNFMIVTEKQNGQKENHKKKAVFYRKWSNKWLELAEHYKEKYDRTGQTNI